jgi:hypothetical protein
MSHPRTSEGDGDESHDLLDITAPPAARNANDELETRECKISRPFDSQLWTPTFLNRTSLFVLLACSTAVALTLPILYTISERNNGLCATEAKLYYLWTCGPTAVLTLIAVFWDRLVYHSKQLMPWIVMRKSSSASQTILLDYISVWSASALYAAIKKAHYYVVVPLAGQLVLTLMIIVSTGLFSSHEVIVEGRVPMEILEAFNDSARLPTSPSGAP